MSFSRMALADEIADRLRKGRSEKLADEIAAYLIEKNKVSELNSLERDIIEERSMSEGVVELTALSSHALEQSQINNLELLVKKLYPGCTEVIVNSVIDQSVTGGIRLEFANQLLDMSVGAKLNKLRELTAK